jgi:outer membrane lipoprotein-sorting protein
MRALRVVLMAASVLSVVSLRAQTVDEIASKQIEALGGKDKLSAIKTVTTEYDMEVMGQSAPGTTLVINGKAYKNEINFGGQKIIQCVTDTAGWALNPMMGVATPVAMSAEEAKMSVWQLDPLPLLNYTAKGYTVELAGKESLNGKDALKLKLKGKDGLSENTLFIDPATWYVIKSVVKVSVNGMEVETSLGFSNYKKTEYGIFMPYTTEISMPQGFTLNLTTKKIDINKEIDPKLFEMPKQ